MRYTKRALRVCDLISALKRADSGIAATEFAMLLPVLVLLFFGLVESSTAMTVNRKVAIAANTLGDLVAQSEEIQESEVDDLFAGVMEIVRPHDPTGMVLRLVSVVLDEDGDPVVHWSRDNNGTEPYSEDQDYTKLSDDTIITSAASLVIVEMTYTYRPSITKHILDTPIVFNRQTVRWPRLTTRVQLCDAGNNCTE